MKFWKLNKKWTITIIGVIIVGAIGTAIFYGINTKRVFTRSEYIKEVVVQNQNFEKLLDNFLDKVVSYNGTKEATEKLEDTAAKFSNFVTALKEKLGPKVPYDCKTHYEKMIAAYNIYLEAIDMYKIAVPKNLSAERTDEIKAAENKLTEARTAMKNLK